MIERAAAPALMGLMSGLGSGSVWRVLKSRMAFHAFKLGPPPAADILCVGVRVFCKRDLEICDEELGAMRF